MFNRTQVFASVFEAFLGSRDAGLPHSSSCWGRSGGLLLVRVLPCVDDARGHRSCHEMAGERSGYRNLFRPLGKKESTMDIS